MARIVRLFHYFDAHPLHYVYSGGVQCTHFQILTGADAPVAPVLTAALICNISIAIFWLAWPIFGQKMTPHTCRNGFFIKELSTKNSAQNSNFKRKWLQRHLGAKHVSKIQYLQQSPECSKVSKICSYFVVISFLS